MAHLEGEPGGEPPLIGQWDSAAPSVVASLRRHIDDPNELTAILVQVLHLLHTPPSDAAHTAYIASLIEHGAAQALLCVLRSHTRAADATIAQGACLLLEVLVHDSPTGSTPCLDDAIDGCQVLVAVLRTYDRNPELVKIACRIVKSLCDSPTEAPAAGNRSAIASEGGVQVLFDAVCVNLDDVEVVRPALAALSRISWPTDRVPDARVPGSEAIALAAVEIGGLRVGSSSHPGDYFKLAAVFQLLTSVLQRHADNAPVVRHACQVLVLLETNVARAVSESAYASATSKAVASGLSLRLAEVLDYHKEDAETVCFALFAVARICNRVQRRMSSPVTTARGPSQNLEALPDTLLESIMAALRGHASSEKVAEHGLMTLSSCIISPERARRVAGAGACMAAVDALRRFPGSTKVAFSAYSILAAGVAASPDVARGLVGAGAVDVVLGRLQHHHDDSDDHDSSDPRRMTRSQLACGDDSESELLAFAALSSFVSRSVAARAFMSTAARVRVVVEVLNRRYKDLRAVQSSANMLCLMALHGQPDTAKMILASGAVQAQLRALSFHISTKSVVVMVAKLLEAIAGALGDAVVSFDYEDGPATPEATVVVTEYGTVKISSPFPAIAGTDEPPHHLDHGTGSGSGASSLDTLLRCMRLHIEDADTFGHVARALFLLSHNQNNAGALRRPERQAGLVVDLAEGLLRYRGDSKVALYCIMVLAVVVARSPAPVRLPSGSACGEAVAEAVIAAHQATGGYSAGVGVLGHAINVVDWQLRHADTEFCLGFCRSNGLKVLRLALDEVAYPSTGGSTELPLELKDAARLFYQAMQVRGASRYFMESGTAWSGARCIAGLRKLAREVQCGLGGDSDSSEESHLGGLTLKTSSSKCSSSRKLPSSSRANSDLLNPAAPAGGPSRSRWPSDSDSGSSSPGIGPGPGSAAVPPSSNLLNRDNGFMSFNIGCLASQDDETCEVLARMGAGAALVAVLKLHVYGLDSESMAAASGTLAWQVSFALRNIAAWRSATSRLMTDGAAQAEVEALRTHLAAVTVCDSESERGDVDDAKRACARVLCCYACGALRNLAASPENRLPLMAAGACDAALLALRSPHCDGKGAWAACGLLVGLAFEPANCEQMLRAGVAEEAIAAMRKHPADSNIGWAVSGVLLKLAAACADSLLSAAAVPAESASASSGVSTGIMSADACGGSDCLSDTLFSGYLPLLQEGVGAALAMHGSTDARVALAAVTAVRELATATASAVLDLVLPERLRDAVRATLTAHEALAAAAAPAASGALPAEPAAAAIAVGGSGLPSRCRSSVVVELCRRVLPVSLGAKPEDLDAILGEK